VPVILPPVFFEVLSRDVVLAVEDLPVFKPPRLMPAVSLMMMKAIEDIIAGRGEDLIAGRGEDEDFIVGRGGEEDKAADKGHPLRDGLNWCFRYQILDRLDEYFICIKRLRKHDPDAYDLYSRVGFSVPPDGWINGLAPEATEHLRTAPRLSFGGVSMTRSRKAAAGVDFLPSFVYFTKMTCPKGVEPFDGGDVYCVSALYDDRQQSKHWKAKLSAPVSCHVGLAKDGTVTLLREAIRTRSSVMVGRRKGTRTKLTFHPLHWAYPSWLYDFERPDRTLHEFARLLFGMAFLTYQATRRKILVQVRHKGDVATFGIDLWRAKRFFADRDATLATDGRRKRIFHSVVEHSRELMTGHSVRVKAHFRGARDFHWQSYGVHIVFPTVKVNPEFAGTYYEDLDPEDQDKMVGMDALGQTVAGVLAQ